ncbi:MAG: tail fiber domain-containing protein [Acidobacteria bacterium]|nr:tail fiber domain-containing protein [Acidobacteriota bacterium]
MKRIYWLWLATIILTGAVGARAQTTAFTYQGKLSDNGLAANGGYDLQFRLFNGVDVQVGATQTVPNVTAVNGIFTVRLDFGAVFDGSDRYLEIGLKPAGSPNAYTVLAPRQPVTSAPYAIQSRNAATADQALDAQKLGGTAADQYVVTGDARLTDDRNPRPDSNNYIQNTDTPQNGAGFNVSGSGRVGGNLTTSRLGIGTNSPAAPLDVFGSVALNDFMLRLRGAGDASAGLLFSGVVGGPEFRSGGGFRWTLGGGDREALRLDASGNLGLGTDTPTVRLTVAGDGAVSGNFSANRITAVNDYFINNSRVLSITGSGNVFVGAAAGTSNSGADNTFTGNGAGFSNTTGTANSVFGRDAGLLGVTGSRNSFFGAGAGFSNTRDDNSFFGYNSGRNTTLGNRNAYFGTYSGESSTFGFNNAYFGYGAGRANTTGNGSAFFGYAAGDHNTTGINNTVVGAVAGSNITVESDNTILGFNADIEPGVTGSTAIGANARVATSNQIVLGTNLDSVRIPGLLGGGSNHLCFSNDNVLQGCSSSLRYKTNFAPYTRSFDVINQLKPIAFNWKADGTRDIGFGAEDVAKIDPLLVTYNGKGEVEGVKYERLSTVFVNAIREQQAQIRAQQELIEKQAARIKTQESEFAALSGRFDALTAALCRTNRRLAVCGSTAPPRVVKKRKRRTGN